jgi:AraC-like DNA-binding protein
MRLINVQKLQQSFSTSATSATITISLLACGGQMANLHLTAPLEKQRIFRSRNPDEAVAFLHGKQFRFDLSRRAAKQLDLQINGIYLPNLYVGYIQYGSPATIQTNPERDDYWLQLPIREHIEFTVAHRCISCGPHRAAVSSPTNGLLIRTNARGARFNISLTASALTRQLAGLLGTAPTKPLEFAPSMNLSAGYGRSLAQYVCLAVMDFERAGKMPWDAITTSQFEQFIMYRLLLDHPNNYIELLGRRERSLTPRDLRRALDYMHANLAAPITVADISDASGIAGRTLFQYFRDFRGTSPMRYLRDARFEKVRQALRIAKPEEGIAQVARKWGFSHLGRFAIEYRKRFGESPSETARNRRNACSD